MIIPYRYTHSLFQNSFQTRRKPQDPELSSAGLKCSHHLKATVPHVSKPPSKTPEVQTAVCEVKMKAASNSSSRDTHFFFFQEKCNYQSRSWPPKWGLTLLSSHKHLQLLKCLQQDFEFYASIQKLARCEAWLRTCRPQGH